MNIIVHTSDGKNFPATVSYTLDSITEMLNDHTKQFINFGGTVLQKQQVNKVIEESATV